MLWKPSDRARVMDLQWHAANSQIEKLADWLLAENEDFSRSKFAIIVNVAEKMQKLATAKNKRWWSK